MYRAMMQAKSLQSWLKVFTSPQRFSGFALLAKVSHLNQIL